MEFKIYNNLFGKKTELSEELMTKIHKIVCHSILTDEKIYNKDQKKKMIKVRDYSKYKEMLSSMWIMCAYKDNELMAFCGIAKKGNKYEYKILQVVPEARGLGLARILTDVRDQKAWEMNIRKVYLTSLCFPKTIEFHFKRGFEISGDQSNLAYSIRMERELIDIKPIKNTITKINKKINIK
jgi:N-acetylglutamate synthase-like GNAT family acetyltransferase